MDDSNASNWRGMFEPQRQTVRGLGGVSQAPPDELPRDDMLELDTADYKPWVLQRGRTRPIMMLHLRRFEPRSGLWTGWQLAYSHLVAAEYTGDKMLSLDFGTRQFMLQGSGLDELAARLQQGDVLMAQEYCDQAWPLRPAGPFVSRITRLGDGAEANPPR